MKKHLSFAFLVAAGIPFAHAQSLPGTITKIPEQLHRRAALAIVKVIAGDQQHAGAGIIIGRTRNGASVILTTNSLVTGFENQLSVQLENQTTATPAQIITPKWRNRDLVLLATRARLPGAPALDYGRSDQLAAGDEAAVLGFPQTSFLSQNAGEIVRNTAAKITLNFAISPGQNGGPLVDRHGRVIGIAISRGQENGEALPIDLVRFVTEDWLRNTTLAESWHEGKNTKHWYSWALGIVLISAAGLAIGMSGVL